MSRSEQIVRETFIATKRHDLRTPINAILGYSEMLLEDAREEGKDSRAADLEKIHTAGRALLHSVNDLLDPEKIASGHVDLSDMAALGARIEHRLRSDLTAVIGYSEMLLEEVDRDNEEQVAADLDRICTAAERLGSHVKDVIDFSGVVIGQDEFETEGSESRRVISWSLTTRNRTATCSRGVSNTRGTSVSPPRMGARRWRRSRRSTST